MHVVTYHRLRGCLFKGLALAVGLIFSPRVYTLHEKISPILLALASFRKLHLMASMQLIIFIMVSKTIVCRLNVGIKTNRHLNIR
jgi:hypothetical protein